MLTLATFVQASRQLFVIHSASCVCALCILLWCLFGLFRALVRDILLGSPDNIRGEVNLWNEAYGDQTFICHLDVYHTLC